MIPSHKIVGLALGFAAIFLFGATLPVSRLALEHFDAWFITAVRGCSAGLAAASLLAAFGRRPPPATYWPRLVVISLLLVLGFPLFTAIAMEMVPAARGGVVLGIQPLATAMAAALLAGERPSPAFWGFAAAGSAIVVIFALRDIEGGYYFGDIFLIAATVSSAIGYTLSGQMSRDMPGWEVISWALVLALPFSLAATWFLWPQDAAVAPVSAWLQVGFLGLMPQFLAFFAWNAGMAMSGVARVGQMQLLQPFITIGLAALLVGEHIDPVTLLFAAAIVITVGLGSRTRITLASALRLPPEEKSR